MRHFYQLWACHGQHFCRMDMCSRDEEHAQWCLCPCMGDGSHIGSCQFSHFKFSWWAKKPACLGQNVRQLKQTDSNSVLLHRINFWFVIKSDYWALLCWSASSMERCYVRTFQITKNSVTWTTGVWILLLNSARVLLYLQTIHICVFIFSKKN